MDLFSTGPLVRPSGTRVTLYVRTDKSSAHNAAAKYMVDLAQISKTSAYFRAQAQKRSHNVAASGVYLDVLWPDLDAVEGYLSWLQDRIIRRLGVKPPTVGRKRTKFGGDDVLTSGFYREEVHEMEDYRTLVGLWLFGRGIEDVVFRDTVMSLMEWMIKENGAAELFLAALTPGVVLAVWGNGGALLKLGKFFLDAIARYAPHMQIQQLLDDDLYDRRFKIDLLHRVGYTVPIHQLPDDGERPAKDLLRVEVPPFRKSFTSITKTATIYSPYPPFATQVQMEQTISGLSGTELQALGASTMEKEKEMCMCAYHDHYGKETCWWDFVPDKQ